MTDSLPQIIMTGRALDTLEMPVDEHFLVHRTFGKETLNGVLQSHGDSIEGIAHVGHTFRIDAELMNALPELRIISNFGVGYDGIDAAEAGRRGIVVTNTPDVLTEEVADTAIGLLLMTVRELGRAEQWVRAGNWSMKGDYRLTPLSLRGRKVGIVGLGRIGKAIAKRCEGFGLEISYFGRTQQDDLTYTFFSSLAEMAAAVDTLIVVTPGTPQTKNLVDGTVLEALGPQGVLVNIARGTVVEEFALIEALKSETIAAAGLDVMLNEPNIDPELMSLENCVLLPHVGSASVATRKAMAQLAFDNLIAYKQSQPPLTPVPETPFQGWTS